MTSISMKSCSDRPHSRSEEIRNDDEISVHHTSHGSRSLGSRSVAICSKRAGRTRSGKSGTERCQDQDNLQRSDPDRNALRQSRLDASFDLKIGDYGNSEKIVHLPRKLTEEASGPFANGRPGDLCYFKPWGNLALFYADYRWDGLIRLGRFEDASTRCWCAAGVRSTSSASDGGAFPLNTSISFLRTTKDST